MDKLIDTLYLILSGVMGLVFGSFLNVLIYRLPNGMNIAFPASHCPECGKKLRWYHNIPVFSWIFLGGKCAFCKKPIPARYTVVELLNCILWIFCYMKFGQSVFSPVAMLFVSCLITIGFIDSEYMIIPDSLSITAAVLGIVACVFSDGSLLCVWWERLIGGVGGFLLSLLLLVAAEKVFKKEAFGGGDVKLIGAAGLVLGHKLLLLSVFIAAVFGLVFALITRYKGRDSEGRLPFAPFLSAAMIFSLFLGNLTLDAYMSLFGV